MSDPTSELETWAATYRAARRPSPARRRAIAAGVLAGAAVQDRQIRRQRWLGMSVLLAAGIVGALALARLLGGTATRVGTDDERSIAPYSVSGGPAHEAREGEGTPQGRAAGPGSSEAVVPEGGAASAPAEAVDVGGDEGAASAAKAGSRGASERRRAAAGSDPATAPDDPASSPPDELESMRLLRDAERRLETDAAESLRLLERHEQRFPSSSLALEREALTVIALCRLHRTEAGRTRMQSFLRRPGSSAYAARLRSACDEPAAPTP